MKSDIFMVGVFSYNFNPRIWKTTLCRLYLTGCSSFYLYPTSDGSCCFTKFHLLETDCVINFLLYKLQCRSQWPRGLRRRSAATRLLRLWVRIPLGAWMLVCCKCYVCLSGRGLCFELITRPEGSYRLWCVVVCDLETS